MAISRVQIRRLHFAVAPVMVIPLILTLLTGSLYQVALLRGAAGDFFWLMEFHKGKFGPLDLQGIYPFLNAFGALVLAVTGITMWIQMPKRR